jgi:hypothetical protein
MLAGVGIDGCARVVASMLAGNRARLAAGAGLITACTLTVVAAAPQAIAASAYMTRISLPDTRAIAKTWIETNLPQGARIAREFYTPPLDPERFDVEPLGYFGLAKTDNLERFDYLVASSGDFGRFVMAPENYPDMFEKYSAVFQRYPAIKVIRAVPLETTGPTIRVLATAR